MNLTLVELKEKLMQFDELDLIELLDLTSEDILNRFDAEKIGLKQSIDTWTS